VNRRSADLSVFAGIGTSRDGSGAYLLAPLGVPRAVSAASLLLSSSSTASASAAAAAAQAQADHASDPDAVAGILLARSLYTGVAGAWKWTAVAAAASTLAAAARVLTIELASAPEALAQTYRLARMALSLCTAARIMPTNANPLAGPSSQQVTARDGILDC
jgi:hypothetical protein